MNIASERRFAVIAFGTTLFACSAMSFSDIKQLRRAIVTQSSSICKYMAVYQLHLPINGRCVRSISMYLPLYGPLPMNTAKPLRNSGLRLKNTSISVSSV